ncbi:MAG: 50S ribosomal protein L22 [Spirochaetes bacterium]|nr:50S ribosomal protein L22 [Spirochaetota bacterium]MBN2769127.1 50S ribosomal protein L22 [Spirochaetota bacterium]
METKAIAKTVRMSPMKARLVADNVRGMSFPVAVDMLSYMPNSSAAIILKTLKSAGANAKNIDPDLQEADLFVKKITIDEGVRLKRFRPRARGRASRIRKKTSHVTVVLSDE